MDWLDRPRAKDLKAANNFLSLRYEPGQAARLSRKMRGAAPEMRRADDVLRACNQDPLPGDDPRLQAVLAKVLKGKPLPPPLIAATDRGAELANGLHHLSIAYHSDPACEVPVIVARDF